MNQLPSPPCERELPDQQRRRAELLAAIGTAPESSRRKVFVPLGTAASVLGLVAGGAVVTQSLQSQQDPSAPRTLDETVAGSSAPKPTTRQAPPVHNLTPGEQNEALDTCVADASDWQGFEPVLGVSFGDSPDPDAPPDQPRTFLVAERGGDRLYCTFDEDGRTGNAGLFGSSTAKDIPYLFAPVDGKGAGFGMFTEPVAKVTLQRGRGPERAAALRDGYWFLPITPGDISSPPGEDEPQPDDAQLIGVPPGYTIRGYDKSGELVYDSGKDGPTLTCYTDPAGKEVLVHNGVDGGNPNPEDCRRTYEWKP